MKKFFLTMAVAICGLTASAQWVKPTIGSNDMSKLTPGEEVYLYNTGTEMFLNQGNANGVQADVAEEGMKVKVEKMENEGVWDEKSYTIHDFNTLQNKWYYVYIDGEGRCFMNGGKPSDYLWEFEAQDNGTYRIHAAEANPTQNPSKYPSCYLGLEIMENGLPNTIVHPFIDISIVDETSVYCIDWAFLTEEVYTAYLAKKEVYNMAIRLKTAIDECTAKGLDASSLQKVYDNTASSLEELQAAVKQAEALASAEDEKRVTPDNPKDFTDRIANPTFDEGVAGWLCEYTGAKKNDIPKADPGWAPEMVDGVMMAPAVSMWLNNNSSHLWQVVEGIPNGIYELSAGVWSDNNGPVLYANDAKVAVGKTGAKRFAVLAYVGDNSIDFGLTAPADGVQWYMADYFQLQYFGNGTDAYKKWVDETLSEGNIFSDQVCYTPLKEAYNASFEVLTSSTEQETLVAEMPKFTQLYDEIKANVAAYADYQTLLADAEKMVSEGGYSGDDFDVLSDYVGMDEAGNDVYPNGTALYILKGTLDTDGIVAETEFLNQLIQNVLNNGDMDKGADVTAKLINPNFTDGIKGWQYDTKLGKPAAGGLAANPNVERWNENFDFYQNVELPNGVYRVDAQAFYRTGANTTAVDEWTAGTAEVLTELYANTGSVLVKNVYEQAKEKGFYKEDNAFAMSDEQEVPNSMKTASEAFTAGLYENTVTGVVWDGKLRLGIRSLNASANDRWSIWDNFRLTFLGFEAAPIEECHKQTVAEAEELLNGDLTEEMQQALLAAKETPVDYNDPEGTLETIAKIRTAMDTANNYQTGIATPASAKQATPAGIYNFNGMRLNSLQKGLNIVRMSNGTVKKVMVK